MNHKLDIPFDEKLFFEKIKTVLKDNSFLVFFGRGVPLAKWMCICEDLGFKFREEIIWAKEQPSNFMNIFPRQHELAMIFSQGNINFNKVGLKREQVFCDDNVGCAIAGISCIISELNKVKNYEEFLAWKTQAYLEKVKVRHGISNPDFNKKTNGHIILKAYTEGFKMSSIIKSKREKQTEHPTQKPIDLMSKIVKLVSKESDTVLDPFMGSASTGVACFQNKRKFIGIEKDKEYYELAVGRMNGNFKKQKTFFPE